MRQNKIREIYYTVIEKYDNYLVARNSYGDEFIFYATDFIQTEADKDCYEQ